MISSLSEKFLREIAILDIPWVKKNQYDCEGAHLHWLPVAKLCDDRFLLGLTMAGFWARLTTSGVQELRNEKNCVVFLPMIEGSPKKVRQKIIEGLKNYGLSEEFIGSLPFEEIVMTGLESQSEYWCGLALKWVLAIESSYVFKSVLEKISEAGETQKIRHTARKILSQLGTP
ncbi:hypothetical protein IAE35_23180 [Pseudomonas sp. S75]|uniref:hypothetical protein n=1 Tax=unclassified Pseudomonas TaxID=196821 RepID=UPI001904A7B1|nr:MULTISPECIES: hypothetical protein [unclassified Pseudomonas]MBJ9978334.1 hypothetical protein [Pseudomonas sp. S30]MBK0156254.1 hypothetical protein [Pseudomonas sp. S75]